MSETLSETLRRLGREAKELAVDHKGIHVNCSACINADAAGDRLFSFLRNHLTELADAWDERGILRIQMQESTESLQSAANTYADLARDERLFIPGSWKCLVCGFVLQRTSINAHSGDFGTTQADREDTEPCPNDSALMVRVSWEERCKQLGEAATSYCMELREAEQQVEQLRADRDKPIDMMLWCPKCGFQHVDAAEGEWTNPPHKSHLCHNCTHIWRPAEVFTNGVQDVSRGTNDSPKAVNTYLQLGSDLKQQLSVKHAQVEEQRQEITTLRGEVERLQGQHREWCDAVDVGPDLGPSTKPCNCRLEELAKVRRELAAAKEREAGLRLERDAARLAFDGLRDLVRRMAEVINQYLTQYDITHCSPFRALIAEAKKVTEGQ